jgi:MYXO-CTERM domain-containing protein
VRPALDLAFAPRGELSLDEMLRQNVPELSIEASTTTAALLAGATGTAAAAATTSSGSGSEGGGGCGACSTASSEQSPSPLVGLLFALLGFAALAFGSRRS